MLFSRGHLPRSTFDCRSARAGQIRILHGLVLLALGLLATQAGAQQYTSLTLEEAERLALSEEPGREVYIARAEAIEEQSVAVGQLPDPQLRVGLLNYPIESGNFRTENMTQALLGIRQTFQPRSVRSARTQQFSSLAAEMTENAEGRTRDVRTAVRIAWLDTYYWGRAHEIVSEARPLFDDLATVTRSLYAVGSKDRQDVLRAELELSRIDDRLIDIEKQQATARAALSEWVGTAAQRPLPENLPDSDQAPDLAVLEERLATQPALKAADARVEAQQHGVELAQEQSKPDWAIDVGYGYRDGRLPNGDPRSDFITVIFTMDLPFFQGNRQDRELAAALGERRAADESRDQLHRRLSSRLDSEYARGQELGRRIDLYERLIITQTEGQAGAALTAYQSEAGDFADVMRSHIDEFESHLELIRLKVERAQSHAVLANLGGITP